MWRLRGGHSPLATTDKSIRKTQQKETTHCWRSSHLFHISIFLAFVKLVKLCEHICKYVKTLHLTHSPRAETIQISNAYHTSATLRTMTLKRTQFRGAAAECESRQGPYSSMFNLCADWASVWFFEKWCMILRGLAGTIWYELGFNDIQWLWFWLTHRKNMQKDLKRL